MAPTRTTQPSLVERNGIWYLRRHIPEALRSEFGGKREVWRSLATRNKREAESRYHAAMVRFDADLGSARNRLAGKAADAALLATPELDAALSGAAAVGERMHLGGLPF